MQPRSNATDHPSTPRQLKSVRAVLWLTSLSLRAITARSRPMGNFNKFQSMGVPDVCACRVKIISRVGSSAQCKQDNHDRDQGGNRSESFDDRCRHALIFSIFRNLPLGRPGNSREKTKSFRVFLVFCFCDVTCGSLVEIKMCPVTAPG